MRRALPLLAFLALLAHPEAAYAGKGDEAAAGLLIPIVVAVLAYPVGLALHCLIFAYAPRRGRGLVSNFQNHRAKTLVLGAMNTVFLALVALTLKKPAAGLAALAIVLGFALAIVGTYGVANSIGARILGTDDAPADFKTLALGWFVVDFAMAIPGLGLLLGLYWAVRGTGAVVLTLFSIPSQGEGDRNDDPPGDLGDLTA